MSSEKLTNEQIFSGGTVLSISEEDNQSTNNNSLTTTDINNQIFANSQKVEEPSALDKLEYGWDKNTMVFGDLLQIPQNYVTALFDPDRDVKQVAVDNEKKRIKNFKKEHWKMLDGQYDGVYSFLGETASFVLDPYYLAGYYFGSPLIATGPVGSAALNAALLGGDNLISQLAKQGEVKSWGEVGKSAAIGGTIGAVLPIGGKLVSKYLPQGMKDKADEVAMYIDGKLSKVNKLTGTESRIIKSIANSPKIKTVTNEIDKLILSSGFKSAGSNIYAPVANAKKNFLQLKTKLYTQAFEIGKRRKEILKPVKGLTQKNVASKTYYDNVVRPVKARARVEGKKILEIREQIKAARKVWQTENERLIARQSKKLDKYFELEGKRNTLILEALESQKGTGAKILTAFLSNLTRPLVGGATGGAANVTASVMGVDIEDDFWTWVGAGAALGFAQKSIQNSTKLGTISKNTYDKIISNHSKQFIFQKLREFTAGTTATKLSSFGGASEKIGRLLFRQVDDPMSSKSVIANADKMENYFMRKAANLIQGSTPEEQIAAISIVRGNKELAKNSSESVLNLATNLRGWMDEFKDLYNKAGFFSPKELDNYFPRVLNWEAINSNLDNAVKVFADIFKKNYKLTDKKAKEAAETYLTKGGGINGNSSSINVEAFETLIDNYTRAGSLAHTYSVRRGSKDLIHTPISDHITKQRSLQGPYKIVEEVLEKNNFLINDLSVILPKIIQDSTKSIAFAQKFGRGGELLSPLLGQIKQKYDDLALKNNKLPFSNRDKAMKHEIQVVLDSIDAYFGRFGMSNADSFRTTTGILTMLSNLNMLGRVTITSLGDIAQVFQNSVNWTTAVKGMASTNLFSSNFEKGLARNLNYDIAKYAQSSLSKTAAAADKEIVLNTAWMGKWGVKELGRTDFYNSIAFKALGLEWLTGYARRFAYNAGTMDAFALSKQLYKITNGGTNMNANGSAQIISHLTKYNVRPNQALNIGKYSDYKTAIKDKAAFDNLNKAGMIGSNRDALIPQVDNRLLFTQSKTPFIRMLGQFLSWTQAKSAQTNKILQRIERGEVRTLVKTLAVIPVYAGIQQLREYAKHGDVITDAEYNGGELLAKSWQLSGMPGWLSDLVFNRFVGPGSGKENPFYVFAPALNMATEFGNLAKALVQGRGDDALNIIDKKILFTPEWREWARKHWFPRSGSIGIGESKTEPRFALGGLISELKKDSVVNRVNFNEGGFAEAFSEARANKLSTFEWQGNLYNTRRADETDEQYKFFLSPDTTNENVEQVVDKRIEIANEKENIIKSLEPNVKDNTIIPKKKPVLTSNDIVVPNQNYTIPKINNKSKFSLFSSAEAAIPDDKQEIEVNAKKFLEKDIQPKDAVETNKFGWNTLVNKIPPNVRLMVNDVFKQSTDGKFDKIFTEKNLNTEYQSILKSIALDVLSKGKTNIEYADYKSVEGDNAYADVSYTAKGVPNITDKRFNLKTSLGQATIKIDGDGNLIIVDKFNFNDSADINSFTDFYQMVKEIGGSALQGEGYNLVRKVGKWFGSPEGEGQTVRINLGKVDLSNFKNVKIAKASKGGVIQKFRGGGLYQGGRSHSFSSGFAGAKAAMTSNKAYTGGGNGGSSSNNNNNNNNTVKSSSTSTTTKGKIVTNIPTKNDDRKTRNRKIDNLLTTKTVKADYGVEYGGETGVGFAKIGGEVDLNNLDTISPVYSASAGYTNYPTGINVGASYNFNDKNLTGSVVKDFQGTSLLDGRLDIKPYAGVEYNDGDFGPTYGIKVSTNFKKGGLLDKKRG